MSFSRRSFLKSSGAVPGVLSLGFPGGMESSGAGVTRALARFVVESNAADVSEAARKEAVRSIVNWVGCALGGARHETVDCALEALSELSGPRAATVLGRKERLDILHASLLNGISSHVLDFDDTHLETIIHPAGPVAPVLLALAERQTMSGADFLHAFILGVEVECRIGMAVYPWHYDRGYHITGSAGVFGAAAAAGKILGLDETRMLWALGSPRRSPRACARCSERCRRPFIRGAPRRTGSPRRFSRRRISPAPKRASRRRADSPTSSRENETSRG